MIYCLKHRIKFELYSDYTHFALRDGWNDFFVPFGSVNHTHINKDYNLRYYLYEGRRKSPFYKLTWLKNHVIPVAYKFLYRVDYLTQDLWKFHREASFANEQLTIPELGFDNASVLDVTQCLIKALWHYNAQSSPIVANFIQSAGLPEDEYISIHLRAGDKFTEAKTFDFDDYMKPAIRLSANRKAFILTDDYTVLEHLRVQYPDWEFYTLCEPSERGYFHNDFIKQTKEFKYRQHLKLFASMDICARSTFFIGTYSSNPGMYMGMRIGPERCHGIDFDKWVLW